MKQLFLILALVGIICANHSAQTTIHGRAPGFVGKHVYLHKFTDYLSQAYERLDEAIIGDKGNFTFSVDLQSTTEVFIQIQDKSGSLYIDPEAADYYVYFPSTDQQDHYHGKNALLVLDSLQSNDINTLIADYEMRLERFIHLGDYNAENDTAWNLAKLVFSGEGAELLSKFKRDIKLEYKDVENPFFSQYVKYSIAGYEIFFGSPEYLELNKSVVYSSYIKDQPIQYNNPSYMYFLFDFYERPFKMLGSNSYSAAEDIVNYYASYSKLLALLREQFYMKHPQVSELVMMKGILEEYHSGHYSKPNLAHILDSVTMASPYPENQEIAESLLHILTRLEPGYRAPDFMLITTGNDTITLDSLNGKYVYLDFFHTQSTPAIAEKELMPDLKEKYGKYIEFVSISLDEDPQALEEYLKKNPKYNWHFAHYRGDVSLLDDYDIRSLPSYFLIGPDGTMINSNALRPSPVSPGAEYSTIDRTFWSIKERLKPKQGPKVGGMENN